MLTLNLEYLCTFESSLLLVKVWLRVLEISEDSEWVNAQVENTKFGQIDRSPSKATLLTYKRQVYFILSMAADSTLSFLLIQAIWVSCYHDGKSL